MTNADKFQEVYGFPPPETTCVLWKTTNHIGCKRPSDCNLCTYSDWWNWEYRQPDNEENISALDSDESIFQNQVNYSEGKEYVKNSISSMIDDILDNLKHDSRRNHC